MIFAVAALNSFPISRWKGDRVELEGDMGLGQLKT
jgi:hypothetical protein